MARARVCTHAGFVSLLGDFTAVLDGRDVQLAILAALKEAAAYGVSVHARCTQDEQPRAQG